MEFAFFLLCICRIILSKHFLFVCSFRCVAATFFWLLLLLLLLLFILNFSSFSFFFVPFSCSFAEHILLYSLLLLLVFWWFFFIFFLLVKVPEWRRWRFLFALRWFFLVMEIQSRVKNENI